MRFHVLGVPHTVSSPEFSSCAYTQKVVKFARMMTRRGHTVIHYGHEESRLDATEHVPVLSTSTWKRVYGDHDWRKHFYRYDTGDDAYREFYANAIAEIHRRKQRHDFILPFWGAGVRPVCDAHPDLITVEPGIGYAGGHWARWKVFESYAIYHAYCGLRNVGTSLQDFYDVVIPNYFDVSDFEYRETKDDYFLFVGRVYRGKGVNVAIELAQKLGFKLVIAGQRGDDIPLDNLPGNITYVGHVGPAERSRLMAGARALFAPSMYLEPFGGVQVEALLSGTPTITTDWGAFAENNVEGVTGYRCRTFADFVRAVDRIDEIEPSACREAGLKFSLEAVAPRYEKYFQDVLNVYTGAGWYQL